MYLTIFLVNFKPPTCVFHRYQKGISLLQKIVRKMMVQRSNPRKMMVQRSNPQALGLEDHLPKLPKTFQYLKHKFLSNFLQKSTNDQLQKIKYSNKKWSKRNLGPMRASTKPIKLALGQEKADMGLGAPKLKTLVLKKLFCFRSSDLLQNL